MGRVRLHFLGNKNIYKKKNISVCFQRSKIFFSHHESLNTLYTLYKLFRYIFKDQKCSCRVITLLKFIALKSLGNCERREYPSQSYGTPKKCNKILNIGRKTILYITFFYSFSILNWFQTWTSPAKTLPSHFGHAFQKPISPFLWEIRVFALNRTWRKSIKSFYHRLLP